MKVIIIGLLVILASCASKSLTKEEFEANKKEAKRQAKSKN
jgi:hypothetical protein